MLWYYWWNLVCELRPACARSRTFLWMSLCLAGFSTRKDLLGVTSIVRALGLEPACYDRLLDFFHSPALDLDKLTRAWCALVFRFNSCIFRVNGKPPPSSATGSGDCERKWCGGSRACGLPNPRHSRPDRHHPERPRPAHCRRCR